MKQILLFLLILPFFGSTDATLADITKAISEGNADALGQYFDSSVEIAVLDKEDMYNKDEAVKVLKDFFANYKPQSFSQVHQGTSKASDSQYCIGNLVTSSATFRVYIYMKVDGSDLLIQELRFDQE